jgi:glycosyltransferase involved in cell wall biosynthesis
MRTLVLAHSSPAAVRGQQLFGSRDGVRIVQSGAGWRGGLRALWAVSIHRPKVVYLVDLGIGTAVAAMAARATRRHVIVDTGDLVYELERSRGGRSLLGLAAVLVGERLALSSAHHVVVRGREHQRVLSGKPTTFAPDLAPPGAEPRDGATVRAQMGLERRFVVGLVGTLRFAPRLGVCYGWDLVDALKHTPEYVAGLIVGSGEGIEILRARAAELQVAHRCVIVGPVPVEDIAEWIGAMDVALSTQTNDAVGAVRTTGKLPLYLACGCPVLASHVGEAARLLGPLGWTLPYQGVVDRSYPNRLAQTISSWASEPEAMSGRRQTARRLYEQAFERDEIRNRVLALLDTPSPSSRRRHR